MARRDLSNAFGDTSPETHPVGTGAELAVIDAQVVEGEIVEGEIVEPRAARLATLTRTINSAAATNDSTVRAANEQLVRQAGPAIKEAHDDELWREGPWESFKEWISDEFGYSRPYAYQLMNSATVIQALAVYVNTGQSKALYPVLRKHGPDAARQQWETAQTQYGEATEAALKDVAVQLGYRKPPKPKVSAIADTTTSPEARLLKIMRRTYSEIAPIVEGIRAAGGVSEDGEAQLGHAVRVSDLTGTTMRQVLPAARDLG
ncbi:hypothetical protein ACWD2L_00535 [Streptomyces sp. NPDC002754]